MKSPETSVKTKKKSTSKKKETYVNPTERINDKKESDKQTKTNVKEIENTGSDNQTETDVKQTEKLETPVKEKETKSVTIENKTKKQQKDGKIK